VIFSPVWSKGIARTGCKPSNPVHLSDTVLTPGIDDDTAAANSAIDP
jgi:hypothetical protein